MNSDQILYVDVYCGYCFPHLMRQIQGGGFMMTSSGVTDSSMLRDDGLLSAVWLRAGFSMTDLNNKPCIKTGISAHDTIRE